MDYRSLGRTGIMVSPLCLGAMMFGPWGEPDHDESAAHHPPRARRRHQLRRHRRRLLPGRVGGDRRQGPGRRAARRRRPGHQVPRPDGRRPMGERRRRPEPAGQLAALDRPRGREQPAPAADRLDRPLPGAPARAGDRRRGDAVRAHRPAAPGQDPRLRLVDLPRAPDGARRSGSPSAGAWAASSPSSRRTRSWSAASRPTCCRSPSSTGWACCPWSPLAGGWLSGGTARARTSPESNRGQADARAATTCPARTTRPSSRPPTQLAVLAEEAGLSASSTWRWPSCSQHPAVTAPIIGPRTMEQLESQLGAADVDAHRRRARPDRRDRAARRDALARRPGLRPAGAHRPVPAPPPDGLSRRRGPRGSGPGHRGRRGPTLR